MAIFLYFRNRWYCLEWRSLPNGIGHSQSFHLPPICSVKNVCSATLARWHIVEIFKFGFTYECVDQMKFYVHIVHSKTEQHCSDIETYVRRQQEISTINSIFKNGIPKIKYLFLFSIDEFFSDGMFVYSMEMTILKKDGYRLQY